MLWSYSGGTDFATNAPFAKASVIDYVTARFPATFISAGDADPLLAQSLALADALARRNVKVDSLLFPKEHAPALPHEYQLNLDTEAGQHALARSVKFLSEVAPQP
jgi:acetyl esterase/lipase